MKADDTVRDAVTLLVSYQDPQDHIEEAAAEIAAAHEAEMADALDMLTAAWKDVEDGWVRDLNESREEVSQLEARLADMRTVLEAVEHICVDIPRNEVACPLCDHPKPGHNIDCGLAKALAAAPRKLLCRGRTRPLHYLMGVECDYERTEICIYVDEHVGDPDQEVEVMVFPCPSKAEEGDSTEQESDD